MSGFGPVFCFLKQEYVGLEAQPSALVLYKAGICLVSAQPYAL
jgi:hypothetical protein